MRNVTLVKVGGSLLSLPQLSSRLGKLLCRLANPVLLVGGGSSADLIREISRTNKFDDVTSHNLAVGAMDFNTEIVAAFDKDFKVIVPDNAAALVGDDDEVFIIHPGRTLRLLESRSDSVPRLERSWDVTSDSIAAWLAGQLGIPSLLLLKSVCPTTLGDDRQSILNALVAAGQLDAAFPKVSDGIESLSWCNMRSEAIVIHRLCERSRDV